jgi:hypothetical protein
MSEVRQSPEGKQMKHVLVNGAGGFIGSPMVDRLKAEGGWVRAVDPKRNEFTIPLADEFIIGDLRARLSANAPIPPRMARLPAGPQDRPAGLSHLVPALPLSPRCPPLGGPRSAVSCVRGQPACQPAGDRAGLPAGFHRLAGVFALALGVVGRRGRRPQDWSPAPHASGALKQY